MKYYQELTLIPDPEIDIYFIWSKLYHKLHLGFVPLLDQTGKMSIGVSFPEYECAPKKIKLGSKLRLFASDEQTLKQLDTKQLLSHLSDYVHCGKIHSVPDKIDGYAVYQRVRPKNSIMSLAERYAKRHNITLGAALAIYQENFKEKRLNLPFVRLKSATSQQVFPLMIRKKYVDCLVTGGFSSYGLSSDSSVPEF